MSELFSFIKEVFEVVADCYKYAELDFYKLKSEVVSQLEKAKNRGYDMPDYGSLSIKVISRIETSVIIETYYNKGNGKYQKFKKILDLGELTNIPRVVKSRLDRTGEVDIKLSDFKNLYSVSERDIINTVNFDNLYNFTLKDAKGIPIKKELHITDELFYYKVVMVYVYEIEHKDIRVKYFGNIIDIPVEIIEKISSNEDKSCILDVTNTNK